MIPGSSTHSIHFCFWKSNSRSFLESAERAARCCPSGDQIQKLNIDFLRASSDPRLPAKNDFFAIRRPLRIHLIFPFREHFLRRSALGRDQEDLPRPPCLVIGVCDLRTVWRPVGYKRTADAIRRTQTSLPYNRVSGTLPAGPSAGIAGLIIIPERVIRACSRRKRWLRASAYPSVGSETTRHAGPPEFCGKAWPFLRFRPRDVIQSKLGWTAGLERIVAVFLRIIVSAILLNCSSSFKSQSCAE
jgi:hypothetical protein